MEMRIPIGTVSTYHPFAACAGISSRTGGRPARIGTGRSAMTIANR
jgi:alkylated DNA nucleotide flippase Atl1